MTTTVIEVYEIFKELGLKEDKARKVVDLLSESAKEGVATKEDIYGLRVDTKEDINELRVDTKGEINELRAEINKLRTEMKEEISNLDKKIDRNLYILIIILVILNGDKVLQVLSLFVK